MKILVFAPPSPISSSLPRSFSEPNSLSSPDGIGVSCSAPQASSSFVLSQLLGQIPKYLDTVFCAQTSEVESLFHGGNVDALIIETERSVEDSDVRHLINWVRKNGPRWLFICVFSYSSNQDVIQRFKYFDQLRINMLTDHIPSLLKAIMLIDEILQDNDFRNQSSYRCPTCGLDGLSEDGLWKHHPLYHVNEVNQSNPTCPCCANPLLQLKEPFPVHLRNCHGPVRRGVIKAEEHGGVETYSFAMSKKFASSGFWFPAGKVDRTETFAEAAIRETKEEAGLDIQLKGILSITRSPHKRFCRESVIFYAEPHDGQQVPKSIPDYESVGAVWASIEQMSHIPLRSKDVLYWCRKIENGAPIYPLENIT